MPTRSRPITGTGFVVGVAAEAQVEMGRYRWHYSLVSGVSGTGLETKKLENKQYLKEAALV